MKTDFLITVPGLKKALRLSTEDVIFVLTVRRKSITWLASEIGEKRTTTSMVLHGHRNSPGVRKKIHEVLARELAQIPKHQRAAILNAA